MKRALLAVLLCSCVPAWKQAPHDRRFQRAPAPILHERPEPTPAGDWWDHMLETTVAPLGRLISPARYASWLIGGRASLDVNAFGQVPDSPWFDNRIGRVRPSASDLARGPGVGGPPADGPLTVLSRSAHGYVVRDGAGVEWRVIVDAPSTPELTTGAIMIAARLLHAAGYHVPDTYLVDLDPARLGAVATGRQRAVFERGVPGQPVGHYAYRGVRSGDPNDDIPHQRRRSLRGLWLLAAWIDDTGAGRGETQDAFIAAGGSDRGYLRHYLVDFRHALGADGARSKDAAAGHTPRLDWSDVFLHLLSLGLRYPAWEGAVRSPFPAVGGFDADTFDPSTWSPAYPNPAFDAATPYDTYWAASILARFDDALVRAAVDAADYSDPRAADWVDRVLRARRDALLRFAFQQMLAVDDPRIEDGYTVVMTDLEVDRGLTHADSGYHWRVRWNRSGARDHRLASGTTATPRFDLREAVRAALAADPRGFRRDPYLTLSIWRPSRGKRGPRVDLHLRVLRDHILPVALHRTLQPW